MNQQQLQASGPPIASSSRLPPIKTFQHNHSYDDQAAAAAAAALLQIKRSPSSAHAPLLPSFHEIHSSYSSAYPTPGSNGDHPSNSSSGTLFPYLPPIRTDFQQYNVPGSSGATPSAGPNTTPSYFSAAQPPPAASFRPYHYSPNISPATPHSPSSPPRKRKRTSLPGIVYQEPASSSDINGKGQYQERELPINVDGGGVGGVEVGLSGIGDDEGEGEVRCICGYNVDDGFTIQCERCHIWQHAACFSIPTIDAAPEVYLCERCDPYAASHRQLDYEGARRMQQQRLGMAGSAGPGEGSSHNGRMTVVSIGAEPTTVRGATRKKRAGSPKVERKSRGGVGGVTRKRASSAAQPYADGTGGGGRKVTASSGRKKEKEPSPATALHQQRQHPLQSTHPQNTDNTALPTQHLYQPAIQSYPLIHHQASAPLPNNSHSSEEPWTEQYVSITQDIVHPAVRPVLRSFAHTWRGVTAFSSAEPGVNDLSPITSCVPMPMPDSPTDTTTFDTRKTFLHPLSSPLSPPSRPPTYTLHALRPIARQSYVVPYTCAITPSREYLREPTSQYAQLGVPKQGVHLVPPPFELCLDARGVGGEGRWVRSGCHPNAVLRPVVCDKAKRASGRKPFGTDAGGGEQTTGGGLGGTGTRDTTSEMGKGGRSGRGVGGRPPSRPGAGSLNESEEDEGLDVTFGVFAIRDLKAEEEIVLGWEWDDRHVVHELPRLLKEGYGSGTPALRRAMGEVLSTLFSTFTTCACGASAHNCAITQMQKFADLESAELEHNLDPELLPHEQQQHRTSNLRDQRPQKPPDLGPLIGATRGLRTTDRGQGGREGVELVSTSGHVPSVESVARAFRAVASDSGSDANSHATSSSQRRVHFPTPTVAAVPDVVVSSATGSTIVAAPSPRKSWERRYTESRSNETSEEEHDEQRRDGRTREHEPPKKKARTTLCIDSNPSTVGGVDSDACTLEDTLPPKMRKNWIKETLRVLNTEGPEAEDDHTGVQHVSMEIDGNDAGVKSTSPLLEADSNTVALQSPSTALAGLSLRASPVECRMDCPSDEHVPEAVAQSLPDNLTTQTDQSSVSNALSSHSPPRSPVQSHSELPQLPAEAADTPIQHTKPVDPVLPPSAVNTNPVSSTDHNPDVSQSNGSRPPLPSQVSDAAPSHNDDFAQEVPPPPMRKPPIKRRTLADWKSRKEKERAQALLQPPPPASNKPQDSECPPDHAPENPSPVLVSPEVPTGSLPAVDANMDVIESTGSSSNPIPTEQPKENSTQPQHLAEPEAKENLGLQHLNRNEHDLRASAEGDVTTTTSSSSPLRTSPSASSRTVIFGSSADSRQIPPNHPFSPELPNDVQSMRKFSRPLPEDGEINIPPYTGPPQPASRHSSHPPSRPRSPPTHPRSFHAPSPTPSYPRSSPPPFVRTGPPPPLTSDTNPNSRPRPVPSGPRALRNGYPLPAASSSSQYHGRGYSRPPPPSSGRSFYSPGRSFDRDTDRGRTPRSRGRGGSVSGRSFGGGSDRR